VVDYTLAQVRGYLAAIDRAEAASDARLLALITVGSRGDSRRLDALCDRLVEQAKSDAHQRSHR
jgi:hypothetical protein